MHRTGRKKRPVLFYNRHKKIPQAVKILRDYYISMVNNSVRFALFFQIKQII
jgi:hypothetical protein